MIRRVGGTALIAVVVTALTVGVVQAVGAQPMARLLGRTADCSEGNWCGASRGGQRNCDDCCGTELGESLCTSDDETPGPGGSPPAQGCICGS